MAGLIANIDQKRAILDGAKGGFFHVKFVKKDGSIREATCKKWVESKLASEDRNIVQANTVKHKPEYYTAAEINGDRDWININLNTLLEATVKGIRHTF